MNRSILLGLISIFATVAIVGGSAFALFSSAASNTGNTFGAGTLVLKINGSGPTSTGVFDVPSASPGQFFEQKLTLSNTGSIDASSVKVASIGVGGTNPELAGVLTLKLFNDLDNSGTFNSGDVTLGEAHLNDAAWTNFTLPSANLGAGGTYLLGGRLTFDSTADDTFQGKSATFDLNFQANQ